MASTRLTKATRESILEALIKRAYTARSTEQFTKELEFCERVYSDIMERRTVRLSGGRGNAVPLATAVAHLPKGWGSSSEGFKVEFAGQTTSIDKYDGLEQHWGDNKATFVGVGLGAERGRPGWQFQPGVSTGTTLDVFDADHKFSIECTKLLASREDLKNEIARVKASTRATLESVTTIQKLIEMWPEVEPFAAPFLNPKKAAEQLLPVVQRDSLNDALGLPTGAVV